MIGLVLIAAAAVMLVFGADLLTANVRGLASRIGVSSVAIGLVLAGAEPEELVTAAVASARGHPAIAAGDAIGANITMLTLVLGLFVLIKPIDVSSRVASYAIGAALVSALAALCMLAGTVTRAEGALLVALYVAYLGAVWYRERGDAKPESSDAADGAPIAALIGLALVALGGWLAVSGAVRITGALAVRDTGIGLTIVALATSAELLALLVRARRHGVTELAVAALIGSVIGNATASLGVAAVVRPLQVGNVRIAAWAVVPLALLVPARPLWRGRVARPLGALLVLAYLVFFVSVLPA